MVRTCLRRLLPAACAVVAVAAHAQQTPPAVAAPDPLDAAAAVPAVDYRSAFADYRPLDDVEPVAWRESNDIVGRVGGWRAYAREAHEAHEAAAAQGER